MSAQTKPTYTVTLTKLTGVTMTAHLHIRVKLTRRFRARLWLTVRLLRLAAWVSGMNIDVQAHQEA